MVFHKPPKPFGPRRTAPSPAIQRHAAPAAVAPRPRSPAPLRPHATLQRAAHGYGTRAATAPPPVALASAAPHGYTRLSNAYLLGQGISGNPAIYAITRNGKKLLWWGNPIAEIADFVYFGDRDADIAECTRTHGCPRGYTWHHTGHPVEEDHGTMQLVPTDEHEKIPHWGGVAISLGKLT